MNRKDTNESANSALARLISYGCFVWYLVIIGLLIIIANQYLVYKSIAEFAGEITVRQSSLMHWVLDKGQHIAYVGPMVGLFMSAIACILRLLEGNSYKSYLIPVVISIVLIVVPKFFYLLTPYL